MAKKQVKYDEGLKKERFKRSRTVDRVLVKKEGTLTPGAEFGRITEAAGRLFIIRTPEGENVEGMMAGSIISPHDSTNLAVVGDEVWFVSDGSTGQDTGLRAGHIEKVGERRSKLSRRSVKKTEREQIIASNIDQVFIFMAAADPYYNKRLIDRYLVAAEQNLLTPVLVINKSDLMEKDWMKEDLSVYSTLGIDARLVSLEAGHGIEELRELLKGKTTILTGPSGTGKSTFVNAMTGSSGQSTGEISERTTKGRHTTSFVKMFALPFGGELIDSPGIRELGIWEDFDKDELSLYFHDFDPYRGGCRYQLCSHTHEPGCGIKQAVDTGLIDPERYQSYLNIYESIES